MNRSPFNMWVGRLLVTIASAVLLIACDKGKPPTDDLIDSGRKADRTMALLAGNWEGSYQELNPSYDTIFFESLEEKLGFLLSGAVSDSSLIKEVALRDTFDLNTVAVEFSGIDLQSWSGVATITYHDADSVLSLPVSLDLVSYVSDGWRQLLFGAINTRSDSLYAFDDLQHLSFHEAFASPSFTLRIEELSTDSLRFSLPGGYGSMVLARKSRR